MPSSKCIRELRQELTIRHGRTIGPSLAIKKLRSYKICGRQHLLKIIAPMLFEPTFLYNTKIKLKVYFLFNFTKKDNIHKSWMLITNKSFDKILIDWLAIDSETLLYCHRLSQAPRSSTFEPWPTISWELLIITSP